MGDRDVGMGGLGGLEACVRDFLMCHGHDALELEWRLGHAQSGARQFSTGIAEENWDRLKNVLDTSDAFVCTFSKTREGLCGDLKTIEDENQDRQDREVLRKKRIRNFDEQGPTWVVRASVSFEAPAPPDTPCTPSFYRHKRRWSYRHQCWSVDLTRVSGNSPDDLDADRDVCEVEIELVDKDVLLERPLTHVLQWGRSLTADVCRFCDTAGGRWHS